MDKINEAVTRGLAELLSEIKDPRLNGNMISVLRCDVTRDLRWCKVYISVFGEFNKKEILAGLKSASGFMRRELAHRLSLRSTPELIFVLDDSISHGAKIAKMLNDLGVSGEPDESEEEAEEN